MRFPSAPLIEASSYELTLPPEVTEVFVWGVGPETAPLNVCLQYRESNVFTLSEENYLEAEHLLGNGETRYQEFLRLLHSRLDKPLDRVEPGHGHLIVPELARNDLQSFWLPLVRLMVSQYTTFVTPVRESKNQMGLPVGKKDLLAGPDLTEAMTRARNAGKDRQWLVALEKWSSVYHSSTGATKTEAGLNVVNALERLGENYLAEMLLRKMFFQPDGSTDRKLSATAFEKLASMYSAKFAQTRDVESLLELYSVQAILHPSPAAFRSLSALLIEAGHYELALMAGMVVPRPERPLRELLRASRKLDWFAFYRAVAAQLPDPGERNFWKALDLVNGGLYAEAARTFEVAGPVGRNYTQTVNTGLAIQKNLESCSVEHRLQAVLEWERWQSQLPGPFQWLEEPGTIIDYDGCANMYSTPRDLYFRTFRATSYKPVKARFYGPVTLQILARPIHRVGDSKPLTGWIYVREQGGLYVSAINNNVPSQGLSIVGEGRYRPGQEVKTIISFAVGLHELEIHGGDVPVLVRIHAQRPEMALGILPPLTPDTVDAALRGPLVPANEAENYRIQCMGKTCLAVLPLHCEKRPVYCCDQLVQASVTRPRSLPMNDPFWMRKLDAAAQSNSPLCRCCPGCGEATGESAREWRFRESPGFVW